MNRQQRRSQERSNKKPTFIIIDGKGNHQTEKEFMKEFKQDKKRLQAELIKDGLTKEYDIERLSKHNSNIEFKYDFKQNTDMGLPLFKEMEFAVSDDVFYYIDSHDIYLLQMLFLDFFKCNQNIRDFKSDVNLGDLKSDTILLIGLTANLYKKGITKVDLCFFVHSDKYILCFENEVEYFYNPAILSMLGIQGKNLISTFKININFDNRIF